MLVCGNSDNEKHFDPRRTILSKKPDTTYGLPFSSYIILLPSEPYTGLPSGAGYPCKGMPIVTLRVSLYVWVDFKCSEDLILRSVV